MFESSGKEDLINKLSRAQDTKVCFIDVLILKRTLTLSTVVSNNDMCLLKSGVLHETLPPVHYDLHSIQLLAKKYEHDHQAFFFKSNHRIFLKLDEEIIAKILGIPA